MQEERLIWEVTPELCSSIWTLPVGYHNTFSSCPVQDCSHLLMRQISLPLSCPLVFGVLSAGLGVRPL